MPIPNKNNELNRVSARQLVYNEIKNWIVDGTLLPGEFINDNEIAKHFAVSRTPVREAILMLAAQDFVKIIPSKGTQVTPVSLKQATDIYEAVSCMAKEIGRLAVAKHTAGDILELEKLNSAFKEAANTSDRSKIIRADFAFHNYILKIADNPYISNRWNGLVPHTYRYEILYAKENNNKAKSVAEHNQIINAISNKDTETAAALSASNWTNFFENSLKPRLTLDKETEDFLLYHKYY